MTANPVPPSRIPMTVEVLAKVLFTLRYLRENGLLNYTTDCISVRAEVSKHEWKYLYKRLNYQTGSAGFEADDDTLIVYALCNHSIQSSKTKQ
jgi:hypothetical protein